MAPRGCWPIDAIRARLSDEALLVSLCGARRVGPRFDTREGGLEVLVRSIVVTTVGDSELLPSQLIGRTLAIAGSRFPLRARPDVVFGRLGGFHVGEVKSGRIDDSRFQCVVGKAMGEHLASIGHTGKAPCEVEQDLIKILAFAALGPQVHSTALFLVDAYVGRGQSWSRAFRSKTAFVATMRTDFVRDRADELLAATQIHPLVTPSLSATLIVCELAA